MSDVVRCEHCKGTGKCNCDGCYKASGLNPDYSPLLGKATRNDTVCTVCRGVGKVRI